MVRRFSGCLFILFSLCAIIFAGGCEKENNHLSINDLIRHFEKCGLKIESVTSLRSDTIKAEDAAAIKISGREIGVYKYDVNIAKEKTKIEKIEENKFVYIIGLKYPVIVNGSFVLMDYERNPSKDKIIEAFEKFE